MSDDKNTTTPPDKELGLREVAQSVAAAAFGVQSAKNRERDFSKGKPSHFIIVGLAFTLFFILVIFGVVKLVLHLAGV
jgi:hypothetical protein